MPQLPTNGHAITRLWIERAEIARRLFRWETALHSLERAEHSGGADGDDPAEGRHLTFLRTIGRLLVQLEMGLPDLAHAQLDAVRAALPSESTEHAELLRFAELRVLAALDLGDEALAALHEHELRHPTNHSLRLRVVLAGLRSDGVAAATKRELHGWLDEAVAGMRTADERLGALLVRVICRLDAGDHTGAAADLATLSPALRDGAGEERRLGFLGLALRHANDIGSPPASVQEHRDRLQQFWAEVRARSSTPVTPDLGVGLLRSPERQRAVGELIRSELRLHGDDEGPARALRHVVDVEVLGSLARTLGAPPVELATVQAELCPQGGGVLAFAAGTERTFVFVVEPKRVSCHELPLSAVRGQRLARSLVDAVQVARRGDAGDLAAMEAAATKLAALLLPPPVAEALARWRSLVVTGLDSFGYVPFELLRAGGGERLGLSLPIRYVPSLTTGVWLHRRAHRDASAAPNGRSLWIACPEATSVPPGTQPVQALVFGASELSTWRGDGPPPARLLRGGEVTMPAMTAALADADLAVVLAHGVRDARRRDPQGLLLGDGTIAWGRDLGRLPWPRQVVFAACAAGHGRARIGDDGLHLLRGAAFVGGADSVVAPWLDVDYRATLAMLGELHGALAERGQSLAVALWHARRKAHERGGDAALDDLLFHLHGGEGRALAPARPPSPASAAFVFAGAAGLAAAVAMLWRRRRRARYGLRI